MPSLQQLLIFILSLPPRPNNSYRKKTSTLFWSLSSSHVLLRLPTRGSSGSVLTKNKTTADSNWSQKTKQECPTGVRTLPHNEVSHLSKCKHLLKKFGIKVRVRLEQHNHVEFFYVEMAKQEKAHTDAVDHKNALALGK